MSEEYPKTELEFYNELYSELRRTSKLMLESTDEEERFILNKKLVEIQQEIDSLPMIIKYSWLDDYYT